MEKLRQTRKHIYREKQEKEGKTQRDALGQTRKNGHKNAEKKREKSRWQN